MSLKYANKFGRGSGTIAAAATKTFDGATAVDPATEQLTVTTHGYSNGDAVRLTDGGNTVPAGLQNGNVYFVIVIDANEIQLSKTQVPLTPINITADGVGTNTLTLIEGVFLPRQSRKASVLVLGANVGVKYCYDLDADVQLWKLWTPGVVNAVLTEATFDGGLQAIVFEGTGAGNYSYGWD